MKTWGVEVQLHTFLNSGIDDGEWRASRPGRFKPGAHWIRSWMGSEQIWT